MTAVTMVDPPPATSSDPISSLPACNEPVFHNIPSAEHAPLRSIRSRQQTNPDNVIAHLQRAVSARDGHEIALLSVGEAARLFAAVLGPLGKAALRQSRSGSIFATKFRTPTRRFGAIASGTSTRLYALLAILEEWQLMIRMWGLFDMWLSAKEVIQEKLMGKNRTLADVLDTSIATLQTVSMTTFHICEAVTCLSQAKVLSWSPEHQGKFMGWAARFWATFTFIEVARHLFEWSRKEPSDEDYVEWRDQWKSEFFRNLAWAPYTIHWSMPDGFLPDFLLGVFGLYPSLSIWRDIWQATA
ncbi:hypothetical protein BKA56DRAFT_597965 [Ilyonectria sp. MPI-CAGE-AT-0026]|nr:hypothetical protein BKA56DRAFT_597965 [Ilyonectria sp. MPI-CAGE-AT-0026]